MVFTLQRYIFRDLVKTFLLATLILSVVLGLGIMLRPLRQFGVDPAKVPSLILCILPVTLTMVIPIAALLSATLNYGRLAVDNEINACRSSGISLGTLIYPALTLALLVGLVTLLMAFHVIPAYTERFESIIKRDAESIIYRNIESKGNLGSLFPGFRIHADRAYPDKHLLTGVVLVTLDRDGIEQIMTARQVQVLFEPGEESNQLFLRLFDHNIIAREFAEKQEYLELSLQAPSMWRDDIKFKNLDELKAIQEDAARFAPVAERVKEIREQILVERFFEYCRGELKGRGHYLELQSGRHPLRIYASDCSMVYPEDKRAKKQAGKNRSAEIVRGDMPVEVALYHDGLDAGPERRFWAEAGELTVMPETGRETVMLTMTKVKWSYVGDGHEYRLERHSFGNIAVPAKIVASVKQINLDDLLRDDYPLFRNAEASLYLVNLIKELREECQEVGCEIEMEIYSRLAFGVSCVVLVLLGAALGIMFKSGHLLTAFGVSFIPAALCLITIFTGKHIAEQSGGNLPAGIMFLWSGIIAVAIADLVIYNRLLKQ